MTKEGARSVNRAGVVGAGQLSPACGSGLCGLCGLYGLCVVGAGGAGHVVGF